MASTMTKRGQADNVVTYEFVCDTISDLQKINPKYITMGSIATVIEGESGFEVYMANSQKEWMNIGGGGSNNSGSSEPAWVNQDIITNIPETYVDNEGDQQQNIQLNNHTITGNITLTPNQNYGKLAVEIDPSISSSFMTLDNYTGSYTPFQECYVLCAAMPWPENQSYSIYGDSSIGLTAIYTIFENQFEIQAMQPNITSLNIYKIPKDIFYHIMNNQILASYLFSKLQPEATYDVSQITYITPEAGE